MTQPQFPNPFDIQHPDGRFPAVLLVEHARNTIPASLDRLGITADQQASHIAWDIGIEAVTRTLSDRLSAPAIYCLYSRLIVDPNRPLDHAELIPPTSDGVPIPANRDVSSQERDARLQGIYHPYHDAAEALVSRAMRLNPRPLVVGMHSCTCQLCQSEPRPWHIGLSTYDSDAEMDAIATLLRAKGLMVGIHQPYDVRGYDGVSLDTHGRAHGLPQILVEIRQDLIGTQADALKWAGIMEHVLQSICR